MKVKNLFYLVIVFGGCLLFAGVTSAAEVKFNTQMFEPFNYEIGGGVSGPTADVIRKVCDDMKIDCAMRLLPWRRTQEEVSNEIAQGLFTIGWNNEERPSGKARFPTPPWNQH